MQFPRSVESRNVLRLL
uniref:Uncharacterized protein n=1 Tax=Anopheles albimanus TaxID=7167 RepID=A0A182FY16_ANOAL